MRFRKIDAPRAPNLRKTGTWLLALAVATALLFFLWAKGRLELGARTHACESTIVTAFYALDGNKKNELALYWEWIAQFLRFPFCVVIFTAPELAASFGPSTERRRVVPLAFDELRWACVYGREFWAAQHALDDERNVHLPEMYVLWAEKLQFVQRVAALNPFGSDVFYWMDIGSFREPAVVDSLLKRPFPSAAHRQPDDRLVLFTVVPFAPEMFERAADGICGQFAGRYHMAGTAFFGSAAAIARAVGVYQRMFDRFVAAGRFAGKDQDIFAAALVDDPTGWARLIAKPAHVSRDCCTDWFYFYRMLGDPHAAFDDEPSLQRGAPLCADK